MSFWVNLKVECPIGYIKYILMTFSGEILEYFGTPAICHFI